MCSYRHSSAWTSTLSSYSVQELLPESSATLIQLATLHAWTCTRDEADTLGLDHSHFHSKEPEHGCVESPSFVRLGYFWWFVILLCSIDVKIVLETLASEGTQNESLEVRPSWIPGHVPPHFLFLHTLGRVFGEIGKYFLFSKQPTVLFGGWKTHFYLVNATVSFYIFPESTNAVIFAVLSTTAFHEIYKILRTIDSSVSGILSATVVQQ